MSGRRKVPEPARPGLVLAPGAPPAATYHRFILEATPRLLGTLDREPRSPTVGSFDRDHWAWKFRDFPNNMLQAGVLPLAWVFRHPFPGSPYHRQPRLAEWIAAALEAILARQHRNGAFDTVGPNTQDHGVTLATAYTLATAVAPLDDDLGADLVARVARSVRRAAAFASRSDEDYAFISNHQALFALAWWRAGRWLDDASMVARSDRTVDEIIRRQSRDGWYLEYGGPDPGYESLGLHYLAQLAGERSLDRLHQSLDRSLEFFQYFVLPDGAMGGGVGSRHTALWYPAGFELLSGRSPAARAVAERLRATLPSGQVVTPATVDPHNLWSLLYSYCLASEAPAASAPPQVALPCDGPFPLRTFDDSGISVASTRHYYAICAANKGGVISARARDGGLGFEDAGYLAATEKGTWFSGFLGLTERWTATERAVTSQARFGRARREVLTPLKFVVLRLLNLTVFRSVRLGTLVRRAIVGRLITGREGGSVHLERTVRFLEDRIEIDDTVRNRGTGTAWIDRAKCFTAVHMGSARYFHPHELVSLGPPVLPEGTRRLAAAGEARMSLVVNFENDPPTVSNPTGR